MKRGRVEYGRGVRCPSERGQDVVMLEKLKSTILMTMDHVPRHIFDIEPGEPLNMLNLSALE